MHESFLSAHRYRFLKVSVAVSVVSIVATGVTAQFGTPYGGSPMGLMLGIVSLIIMLWLISYSARKRMYGYATASVRDWLSGHVYLGSALMVVVTLHAGFEPTMNIHWSAYAMMMVTCVSGIFGVVVYVEIPKRIARNLHELSFDDLVRSILAVDGDLARATRGLPAEVAEIIQNGQGIPRRESLLMRMMGEYLPCPVMGQRDQVAALMRAIPEEERGATRHVLGLLSAKAERIRLLRRDQRYRTWLAVWLRIHVPATALTAGLVFVHVLTTLYFW